MKIKLKVIKGSNTSHAIVELTSSTDPNVKYEFSSYTDEAVRVVEMMMEESVEETFKEKEKEENDKA
jgi:hypothetical protein